MGSFNLGSQESAATLQRRPEGRIIGAMADLEEPAFRRDRRFLVRLVVLLVLGGVGGLWAVSHLTSRSFAGCAARTMGAPSEAEPAAAP